MTDKMTEPEPIKLSSIEFIIKLRDEYKREIRREYNKLLFNKVSSRYKRMGLNEYLEKDIECKEEIVVPIMDREGLLSLAFGSDVSRKMHRL